MIQRAVGQSNLGEEAKELRGSFVIARGVSNVSFSRLSMLNLALKRHTSTSIDDHVPFPRFPIDAAAQNLKFKT